MNNKMTPIEDTEKTSRTVNGNEHLANMEVHEYSGLKFVVESPDEETVRVTVYKGNDPKPLSRECYGNENHI